MQLSAAAKKAIEVLENNGYEAFCVGGCVRDLLMGREPNDFDVTTSAAPLETERCFEGYRLIETGLKHGTVTVLIDGEPIEITTYRLDGEYLDNRRPSEVFFTRELREDLARRDFTVNAMAYSPTGGLVDCFGGREDIERRLIRAVGDPDRRFHEDGLRILRALRFASVLDFELETETAASIRRCYRLLDNIAAERIRVELFKLVCGRGARRILAEYPEVLCHILPEIAPSVGFDQRNPYHKYDVYTHSLVALELAEGDVCVKLAALLHDVGKPACFSEDERGGHFYGHPPQSAELTRTALHRLRTDNKTLSTVVKLVAEHHRTIQPTERSVRRLLSALGEQDARRLLALRRADNGALVDWLVEPRLRELDDIEAVLDRLIAEQGQLSLGTLALHGDDVIALGVSPGRAVGTVLHRLLDAVIDGECPNEREPLTALAREIITTLPQNEP